jgi:diaminopimelate epimerase
MGRASVEELRGTVLGLPVTVLNVGNPQCAVFVEDFPVDWEETGARIESDARFPKRSNVSFVRVVDEHTIDVRFFERGVGVTMSSGTGSTGAAAAALARGEVMSPVTIETPAGPLDLRVEGDDLYLIGPAEIVVKGEFFL